MSSNEKQLYDAGCDLYEQQNYTDALAKFEAVLQLNPANWESLYQLSRVLNALERSQEALDSIKRAAAGLPDREDVQFDLGIDLYNHRDFSAAIDALRIGLALSDQSTESLEKFAEALSDVALELDISGALDAAVDVYTSILAFNPNDVYVLCQLAMVYTQKNQMSEAVNAIARVKRINPEYTLAYTSMGYLMLILGNNKEALENYQAALVLEPDSLVAIVGEASAFMNQGNYSAASRSLQNGMEKHPNSIFINDELGYVWTRQEKYKESLEIFNRSLAIDATDFRASLGIGEILFRQNKKDEAFLQFQQVLEVSREDCVALEFLGLIEIKRKNFPQAIEYFKRGITSSPFRTSLYVHLIRSQFRTGEFIPMLRSLVLMRDSLIEKSRVSKSIEVLQ